MDVKYINPFIDSVINTLSMFMGKNPEPKTPFVKGEALTQGDITGVIGFAEKNITGSVVLSFPENTALTLYASMTGDELGRINREVEDSIGEITNIVAGGAKTELSKEGLSFHISIPSVIVGKNHSISHTIETPIVVIPFTVGELKFSMEVSMKITKV
jgi:chemotaxis protein CheX